MIFLVIILTCVSKGNLTKSMRQLSVTLYFVQVLTVDPPPAALESRAPPSGPRERRSLAV